MRLIFLVFFLHEATWFTFFPTPPRRRRRPDKHPAGVWMNKVFTAWRTIKAYKASNARRLQPEQRARTAKVSLILLIILSFLVPGRLEFMIYSPW